jgi:dolichol kinase
VAGIAGAVWALVVADTAAATIGRRYKAPNAT